VFVCLLCLFVVFVCCVCLFVCLSLTSTPHRCKQNESQKTIDDNSHSLPQLAWQRIAEDTTSDDPVNVEAIAFLTVTGGWWEDTYIASPVVAVDPEDGSIITDYPNSVGLWSGCGSDPSTDDYCLCVAEAIAEAENTATPRSSHPNRYDFEACPSGSGKSTFGVDKHTSRMNDKLTACDFESFYLAAIGDRLAVQGCSL